MIPAKRLLKVARYQYTRLRKTSRDTRDSTAIMARKTGTIGWTASVYRSSGSRELSIHALRGPGASARGKRSFSSAMVNAAADLVRMEKHKSKEMSCILQTFRSQQTGSLDENRLEYREEFMGLEANKISKRKKAIQTRSHCAW